MSLAGLCFVLCSSTKLGRTRVSWTGFRIHLSHLQQFIAKMARIDERDSQFLILNDVLYYANLPFCCSGIRIYLDVDVDVDVV